MTRNKDVSVYCRFLGREYNVISVRETHSLVEEKEKERERDFQSLVIARESRACLIAEERISRITWIDLRNPAKKFVIRGTRYIQITTALLSPLPYLSFFLELSQTVIGCRPS